MKIKVISKIMFLSNNVLYKISFNPANTLIVILNLFLEILAKWTTEKFERGNVVIRITTAYTYFKFYLLFIVHFLRFLLRTFGFIYDSYSIQRHLLHHVSSTKYTSLPSVKYIALKLPYIHTYICVTVMCI